MSDSHPDLIERSIDINSDTQTVFSLISRPGWWINDGTITDNQITNDGDTHTVLHAEYGEFRIRSVTHNPPHYASFRWQAGESHREAHAGASGTLIEFFLEDLADGVVTLKVRESGFAGLSGTAEQRLKSYRDNESGWDSELEAARKHLEAG